MFGKNRPQLKLEIIVHLFLSICLFLCRPTNDGAEWCMYMADQISVKIDLREVF